MEEFPHEDNQMERSEHIPQLLKATKSVSAMEPWQVWSFNDELQLTEMMGCCKSQHAKMTLLPIKEIVCHSINAKNSQRRPALTMNNFLWPL